MKNAPAGDLTTGSIRGHLIRLSIPASMGMIFNTLYNLTDLWFAGMLSDDALAGMSIAGAVFFLLVGIGAGIQTGTAAMIASDMGRGQREAVRGWLDNAVGIALVVAVATLGIGLIFGDMLIGFLGGTEATSPLARTYLGVTLFGAVFFLLSSVATGALMAQGDTTSARNAMGVGLVANLGLNPALTFGLGMGVAGLALATVVVKAGTALYLFDVLRRRMGGRTRPAMVPALWKDLLRQVGPASFTMLTIILGGFVTLSFVGRFGSEAIAGYTIGLRLEQVLLLPALGLNAATMAVAGQNFGAGYGGRVRETYRTALGIGLGMAALFIPAMIWLSPLALGWFSDDATIRATGTTYLRIDALAFYGYVVLFVGVAALQAMKRPLFPMVLGILRQLVLPASINAVLILILDWPLESVFWSVVGVVTASAGLSHWYALRVMDAGLDGSSEPAMIVPDVPVAQQDRATDS